MNSFYSGNGKAKCLGKSLDWEMRSHQSLVRKNSGSKIIILKKRTNHESKVNLGHKRMQMEMKMRMGMRAKTGTVDTSRHK